jgi:oxalyl-CoA decarboxylase
MATESTPPATLDGFHLVVAALKLNGIQAIHGVVGIPITDLARLAQAEGLRYIGFENEQSAGHAAAISGFLTKTPGICLTVSAPGFLNGMVALANATTNGFPMIQISGSSDRAIVDLQQGDYEELDQLNAAKPYVKASFRVNRPEDIGIGVARAIRAAVSGRPGGVYLDLTAQALSATLEADVALRSLFHVVDPCPRQPPSDDAVDRAAAMLAGARRPLIILGKGAAYAQCDADIRALVEESGIPFLPMSMAKGLLDDRHPQSVATARSFVLAQSDVVVLVGARLNWLLAHGKGPQWSPDVRFVQLDISPTEIDSNRPIAAPVIGDLGSSVAALLAAVRTRRIRADSPWVDAVATHKADNARRMAAHLEADPSPMDFYSAMRAINGVLSDRPNVFVVNEGANTLDFGRNIIDMHQPRKRLDSGTWGVMGIGMGFAIGASVACGGPVVAVEGDSAFGFSGMEISTICRYRLPIVIVVMNNGGVYRGDDVSTGTGDDPAPTRLMSDARYEMLMQAFGGVGVRVVDSAGLASALEAAIASGRPTLINCVIDPAVGTESGHLRKLNPHSSIAHPG